MALQELVSQVKIGKGIPDLALIAVNAYVGYNEAAGTPLPKDVVNGILFSTFTATAVKGNYALVSEEMKKANPSIMGVAVAKIKGTLQGGLLIAPADIVVGKALGYAAYAVSKYI